MQKIRILSLSFKKIPLHFKKLSLSINLQQMTLLPFCMVFVSVVNMCLSLASLEMQLLSYMVLGGVILSFLFMLTLIVHGNEISRCGFMYFLFMSILIGLSFVNQVDFKNAMYFSMAIWLNLMLFRYYRNRMKMIVSSYAIALSFCVYVNLAHLLANPMMWMVEDAKDAVGYLLGGNYNQMGCRMMIAVLANWMCVKFSRLWMINFILVCAVCIATLVIVGSMTSLSMIIVFFVFCLVPSGKLRKIGIYGIFIAFVLFQVFVVFNGRGLENNELAVYIIEDVLRKDMTFTYRTYMWESALNIIEESPIFGWGLPTPEWYDSNMSSFAIGPHNFILSILINGGVVLLALYIVICVMTWKTISSYMDRRDAQILVFGLLALWFMSLMEMYPYTIMFFAMMLVAYYKYMPDVSDGKTIPDGGLKNENADYEREYQQNDSH